MAKVPVKYDYQIVNYRKKWSNYANQKVWWVMLKFEIDIFRVSDGIPFKSGAWHITGLMKHARNINFFANQIANNLGNLSADRWYHTPSNGPIKHPHHNNGRHIQLKCFKRTWNIKRRRLKNHYYYPSLLLLPCPPEWGCWSVWELKSIIDCLCREFPVHFLLPHRNYITGTA